MRRVILSIALSAVLATAPTLAQVKTVTTDHDGADQQATKRVTTNSVQYEFPGQGKREDWLAATKLSREGTKLQQIRKYDECIERKKQAIALYPYDAEFYNGLGISYYARGKKGDLELAERSIKQAIQLKPDRCMFWDNLAKGLYEQGKLSEALDALKTALRFSPSFEKTQEITDNIKTIEDLLAKETQSELQGTR